MPLTDIKARNAKLGIKPDGTPTDKRYKLTDEKGLYLEVTPNGSKWWHFKYRFAGKEKRLSLGVYPEVYGLEFMGQTFNTRPYLWKIYRAN